MKNNMEKDGYKQDVATSSFGTINGICMQAHCEVSDVKYRGSSNHSVDLGIFVFKS